jgi:hypothetical protein
MGSNPIGRVAVNFALPNGSSPPPQKKNPYFLYFQALPSTQQNALGKDLFADQKFTVWP